MAIRRCAAASPSTMASPSTLRGSRVQRQPHPRQGLPDAAHVVHRGHQRRQVVDDYTVDVMTDGLNAVLPVQMTQLAMVPPKAAADRDFAPEAGRHRPLPVRRLGSGP